MSEGTAKGMDDGAAAPAGLRRLFSPLMVGGVELRNRIVSTAHSTGLTDGTALSDALVAYYAARARGGVGLIVTGSTSVHPTSSSRLRPALANWDDGIVAPYRRLAAAVHAHGARIFAQLNHAGALSGAGGLPGGRPLAPSVIDLEKTEAPPRALLEPEIAEIVAAFAAAAARARDGGLDGVELHGGHGNLIQQFLSPHTNRRDDAYGGPLENRLRFAREVAVAVRAAVGPDFTVGLRLSAEEDYPDGLFLPETTVIAARLVAAAGLDYVNVTSGSDTSSASLPRHYAPMYLRAGHMRHLARAIREVVPVPVLAVGRITDPRDAEAILAAGDADLVGMTRALIADRDLPEKARRGDLDAIRYCVGANEGCLGRLFRGHAIGCIQDPTSGREHEVGPLVRAEAPRRVVVVGGGVAGLEAARVAALRGHTVTILEREAQCGGQLVLARRAPGREEIGAVVDNLMRALARLPVELVTSVEATAETVLSLAPDAVVLATGSTAFVPMELDDGYGRLVSTREALDGAMVGDPCLVFDTRGDMAGPTTAEFLARSGRRVALVTSHPAFGAGIEPMTRRLLHERLAECGVDILADHRVAALTEIGVLVRHTVSGRETLLPDVATVVAATGARPADGLRAALLAERPLLPVHPVGDARSPGQIDAAIHDGHFVARSI